MKNIQLQQLDKRIKKFDKINVSDIPKPGWIHNIRKVINMSLSQLGRRLNMTPQGVKELEQREVNKSITLSSLLKVAEILDMDLVYGFVPKEGSIEKILDSKIREKAIDVIDTTSIMMELEDQKNSQSRIDSAIIEKINEFNNKIPKHLWD